MPRKILVVDDEPRILSLLQSVLRAEGLDAVSAKDGPTAIGLLKAQKFDLMISDIRMAPMDGMELFRQARVECPDLPVILLTAFGSVATAIDAMKNGAFDYVTKPFKVDELILTVKRAIEYTEIKAERDELRETLVTQCKFDVVVAESDIMKRVCEQIRRVAPTDATVLLIGESGTGKEVLARAIHNNSRRREKPWIAVNCAALPEPLLESEMFGYVKGAFTGANTDRKGLFEAAEGGTLFLDEIASMPLSLQGKLLRVLQEREMRPVGGTATVAVNVRVLAASNVSLEDKVREGTFRQDLYYRLAVITIDIAPLRQRPEDVLPLVQFFLRKETPPGTTSPRISREAADALLRCPWPGNVRELENAIKHAMAFVQNGEITIDTLPARVVSYVTAGKDTSAAAAAAATASVEQYRNVSLRAFLRQKETEYLEQVIARANGDKEVAAKTLQISLATLYRKLPA
ncbi:MAG: sigma-54-dependent transcriptional regulator [Kiritimatiellia bacterium]